MSSVTNITNKKRKIIDNYQQSLKIYKKSNLLSDSKISIENQVNNNNFNMYNKNNVFNEEHILIEKKTNNLKKNLGIIGGFAIHVGVIIGSGIFITVQASLIPGSPSLAFLLFLWIFGGFISLVGGLCYVQLGVLMPVSGGERNYLAKAFNSQFGIAFSLSYTLLVKPITLAGISQTFGKYMTQLLRGEGEYLYNDRFDQIFAIVCLIIICLINMTSKAFANRTQIFFTVLKILAIIIIIGIGMTIIGLGKGFNNPNPFKHWWKIEDFAFLSLIVALVNVLWSYEGWNTLGAIVGEMKNPQRLLGTIVIIVLYILTILSYVGVLGYEAVESTETVAALFASYAIPKAKQIIPISICASTFGACNGTLLACSRILMNSAIKFDVPQVFGLVHKKQRTPVISIFTITIVSILFTNFSLSQLVNYCAVISWVFYGLTMAALIKLVYKHPELDHSFKLPTVFPAIIILFSIFIVVFLIIQDPYSLIFLALVAFIYGIHHLPNQYLKPKVLVNFGTKIEKFFSKYYNLELANEHDVS